MSLFISNSKRRSAAEKSASQAKTTRYLIAWLSFVATGLSCISLLNILIDPLGRLGNNWIGIYHSAEFEYKSSRIPSGNFDTIFIGSSKTANINPNLFIKTKVFNSGFSGALPEDILILLKQNANYISDKNIVIGIDFYMLNESYKSQRNRKIVTPGFWDSVQYVTSLRTAVYSLQSLKKHFLGEQAYINANGSRNIEHLLLEDEKHTRFDYGVKIETILNSLYINYKISEERINILHEITEIIEKKGSRVRFIIHPLNNVLLTRMKKEGLSESILTFITRMENEFSGKIDNYLISHLSDPSKFYWTSPFYFRNEVAFQIYNKAFEELHINQDLDSIAPASGGEQPDHP